MSSFFNYTFCLPLDSSFRLLSSLAGLSSSPSPQSPLSFLFDGSSSGFFLFFFLVFANFFFWYVGFFLLVFLLSFFSIFFAFFFGSSSLVLDGFWSCWWGTRVVAMWWFPWLWLWLWLWLCCGCWMIYYFIMLNAKIKLLILDVL